MRISLNCSVCTVKRLRVSLGTLVALEATFATPSAKATAPAAGVDARLPAPADAVSGGVSEPIGETVIDQAFEAIEQVNRLMHPTAEGSDLARINSAQLHVATKVHASIGQLLNLARRINALTEGVFDPCTPAQPGRLNDIEVSADETEVICHAPVALDFGGFAKGYAVDCAVEALMAGGCTAGLVNAGGDLRVFGQRNEPVFVRGPGGALTRIELADAALAVSDSTTQQRPPEHQGYYVRDHDAHTTEVQQAVPRLTVPYAAVVASTATIADALSKSVLLCQPQVTARALHTLGAKTIELD